jgi:uncharacterized RDD family membrane protein YckC
MMNLKSALEPTSKGGVVAARAGAYIIDSLIISLFTGILDHIFNLSVIASCCLSIVTPVYFICFHAKTGQTIGKKIFNIRVVDFNSTMQISFYQAFKRELPWTLFVIIYLFSKIFIHEDIIRSWGALMILLIFVTIVMDKNNRGVHDKIADTIVKPYS